MHAVIKGALLGALLITGCSGDAVGQSEKQMITIDTRGGTFRPLSLNYLMFTHVESEGSDRTIIDIPSGEIWRWETIYGNVAFNERDPYVNRVTPNRSWNPYFMEMASSVKLRSARDVVAQVEDSKKLIFDPEIRSLGEGLIFLLPKKSDFIEVKGALNDAKIDGTSGVEALSDGCAYMRFSDSTGDKQMAILLMHVPDRTVDLTQTEDRACITGYFAKNLGLSIADVDQLIFSDKRSSLNNPSRSNEPRIATPATLPIERNRTANAPAAKQPEKTRERPAPIQTKEPIPMFTNTGFQLSGKCEIARIIEPGEKVDWGISVTDGCPVPPIRRAEMLFAYAKAGGLGVKPSQINELLAGIRVWCQVQIDDPELGPGLRDPDLGCPFFLQGDD